MLPYCFTASSVMFMVAVKSTDISSSWILSCRNSSSTKTTESRFFLYSWKYDRSTSLFSISSTLNTFLNPPCLLFANSRRLEEAGLVLRRKLYCCSSPSHFTQEIFFSLSTFCFFFFFVFFGFYFLVYLDDYRKSARFGSFEPFKKYEPGHPA